MPSSIVIRYGPAKTLAIRFDIPVLEISIKELQDHFDLEGKEVSLYQQLKEDDIDALLPIVKLEDGEKGYKLDGSNHSIYTLKASVNRTNAIDLECCGENSILSLIEKMPLNSALSVAISSAEKFEKVHELPEAYDGYVVFELPPLQSGSPMSGMEQASDGHIWARYSTCSQDYFKGVVRISRCCGYLQCYNPECPYVLRTGLVNETQWKGRLSRCPLLGLLDPSCGSLVCKHCLLIPTCILQCKAFIYYCLPHDRTNTTRCAIHMGYHNHPVNKGKNRGVETYVHNMVATLAKSNRSMSCKNIEASLAKDIVMDTLLDKNGDAKDPIDEHRLQQVLETITPLTQRRKLQRVIQSARDADRIGYNDLDSLLELKRRCRYPFIHSVLFPGQLGNHEQPHVFKMSIVGPGSGVDLVNRMQPGGSLCAQWVHFDHVHRVKGWSTMGAHVYDPFIRQLLTIATCEFKVEDTNAQVKFWNLLNAQMEMKGFSRPNFRGFMADEAGANWLAVRTVYNGGPQNVLEGRERTCTFHWEMNMVEHTRKCIRPQFHEEHKLLCRNWHQALTPAAASLCKQRLRIFWSDSHVQEGELPALETWLSWWDVRFNHWGGMFLQQQENAAFIPTVNLSETKHSSMRAAYGYAKHISLYEACAIDLSLSVLQSSNYSAFMSGKVLGTGPSLETLHDRFLQGGSRKTDRNRLLDLTHAVIEEAGIQSAEMNQPTTEPISMRRKRGSSCPSSICGHDSHRPEYITVSTSRVIGKRKKTDFLSTAGREGALSKLHLRQSASHERSSWRDGKLVRWRSKLNKDFKERIGRARTELGEVIRENIIIPNQEHVFNVQTIHSIAKGLTYLVTISEFPRCSCADFIERE